jgi:hypothetical protein
MQGRARRHRHRGPHQAFRRGGHRALKDAGIKVYMQTGDSRRTAQAVAKAVGIEDFRSEVLPKDKAAFVTGCSSKGTWWPWWATASTTARRWPRPT